MNIKYILPENDYGETKQDQINQLIIDIAQRAFEDGYKAAWQHVETIRAWLTMQPVTKRQGKIARMVDELIEKKEIEK